MKIPIPDNEQERLSSLSTYNIVETETDVRLDELTKLAASIFDVPMVIITILDQSRQWFKSKYGLELKQTSRDISFCQYTIMEHAIFEVPDALTDLRFRDNPLVNHSPFIRYYCGMPLISREGYPLGSLGLIDIKARSLNPDQKRSLQLLAMQVVDHFELHRDKKDLERQKALLEEKVRRRNLEIEQKLEEISLKDEKLSAVSAELSRFMYKSYHDLRGPLQTILGLVQLALAEVKDDTVKSYLLLLKTTQEKLDTTLNHLLTIVQVKNHEPVLNPVKLHELFQDCFTKCLEKDEERLVEFNYAINCNSEINTDGFLLEIALEQILNNSIRYSYGDHPAVFIKAYPHEDKIRIDIEDNGSGITEEEKERMFQMFFKNRSNGSGLGLFIAKKAIERLNGEITYSTKKHQGTTFSLLIPCP